MRPRLAATRTSAALLLVAGTALAAAAAPAKKPTPAPAATPVPSNSCATCVERRATLDPALFGDTRIYEARVRPAYEVARKIPRTLDRLHCFCECAESLQFRHKTLLTCFTDRHAAGCGICMQEALLASELKQKGASDDEVVPLVESMFKTEGHPPTHVR